MMKIYYKELAEESIPHLLGFYDLDPYSPTRGFGDRYFWGWKLKDFNNGIFQGGVYTLALLRAMGSFPNSEKILGVIKEIFYAVARIQHKNGSVDEAFPYEYAYSVSSTLAFDLLHAFELIEADLSETEKKDFFVIIDKLVGFISVADETHGFISNHLATAVAAIEKYNQLFNKKNMRGREILGEILKNQSSEGGYLEYEGPDLGYQSLCTYYLAFAYKITLDQQLLESLKRSIEFFSYFIHPDGTIGGEYGSRNTELFYPGGFELLREEIPLAGVISDRMYESISSGKTVNLRSIDPGNFIPVIENYVVAYNASKSSAESAGRLPYQLDEVDKFFPDSGLFVKSNERYYSIVSLFKGGLMKVFDKQKREIVWDDCGYIGLLNSGEYVSTQCFNKQTTYEHGDEELSLEAGFFEVLREVQSPFKLTLLRIGNLTVLRNRWLGNKIKNYIIQRVLTKKEKHSISLKRRIRFKPLNIEIYDELSKKERRAFKWLEFGRKFSTVHMATSKYFQSQFFVEKTKPPVVDVEKLNSFGSLSIRTDIGLK